MYSFRFLILTHLSSVKEDAIGFFARDSGSREGAKPRRPDERRMIHALPSVRAGTGRRVALITLGADCDVGVVGKTCIGVPTRLILLAEELDRQVVY